MKFPFSYKNGTLVYINEKEYKHSQGIEDTTQTYEVEKNSMKFPYYYKEEIEYPYGVYSGVIVFIDESGYEHSEYTEDISQMYAMETILDELGYQENTEKNKYTRKEN